MRIVAAEGGNVPLRWGLAFALMLAAHGVAAWLVLRHPAAAELPSAPPPAALMIDLAPLPAAPAAPPQEVPPGPQQTVSQPPPPQPVVDRPLPPTPSSPAPEVAVPVPPKQAPSPPKRQQPAVRRPPEPQPDRKPAPETTAPPHSDAPPAPSAAPAISTAAPAPPSTAAVSWQGLVLGRLEQMKRYPYAAQLRRQQGVVYLRFTMDRQGRVLDAAIAKSSGHDTLDQETLALVHRAEPLPPPPPEIAGDPITLVVPVQFFLQ